MDMTRRLIATLALLAACGEKTEPKPKPEVKALGGVISPTAPAPSLTSLTAGIPGTSNGQTISWDGTAWTLSDECSDPTRRYCHVDEMNFVSSSACATLGEHFLGAAQSGGTCTLSSTSTHPSIMVFSTVGSGTGGVRYSSAGAATFSFGGGAGESCVTELVNWQTLSTSGEEYSTRFGFGVFSGFAEPADGVYARYDRAANGDIFVFRTCTNSTCTTLPLDGTGGTTNSPIAADTWYTTKMCVNGAGTSATITINGSLRGTITTNIPLESASRRTGVGGNHVKSNGTTARLFNLDYVKISLPFSVAR